MKKVISFCAGIFVSLSAYSVNVSFSAKDNVASSYTLVIPGFLSHTFSPEQMELCPEMETYISLKGTADEYISFTGNWECNQSKNQADRNWIPMSTMPPFKLSQYEADCYLIRCTTKPAEPLTISSTYSFSPADEPIE